MEKIRGTSEFHA